MDNKRNTTSTNKTKSVEHCIRCGKSTDILIDTCNTSIEKRKYFIEGSGQMCKECWEEVFGELIPIAEE